MSSKEDILSFIIGYETKQKPHLPALTAETECNLIGDGYLDSLDFINLIGAIEVEFDIEIDLGDFDPETFTTLHGLVDAVEGSKI